MEKVRILLISAILGLSSLVSLHAEEHVQNFTSEFITAVVRIQGLEDS